jgi:rubrerythrin
MTANALNSFGSILSFAVELEDSLRRYYDQASGVSSDDLAELFENYVRKSGKRKQRLISIRQDNVTEMVLEPISGLDAANYELTLKMPTSAGEAIAQAIELEQRAERFYTEAEPKLNVTEPRRAFKKLAQENAERLSELREFA